MAQRAHSSVVVSTITLGMRRPCHFVQMGDVTIGVRAHTHRKFAFFRFRLGQPFMASSKDYKLGEFTFPRGCFMVGSSAKLTDKSQGVRFFGQSFALECG